MTTPSGIATAIGLITTAISAAVQAYKNWQQEMRSNAQSSLESANAQIDNIDAYEKAYVIANKYADFIILTSEDPKNESIFQILSDLTKGIEDKDYYITLDRKEAINLATNIAKPNDIILITGKGNEQTETIKNYTFKHNDYNLIIEKLK